MPEMYLTRKLCWNLSPFIEFKVCKAVDSPANSPGGRRGSIGTGGDSSSRSRDRTSCVVPSPLAANNAIEDTEGEFKTNPIGRERKDFSRLFVPIPPSPGAMDCCTGDSEESPANHHDFSTSKNREQVSKEFSAANGKYIVKSILSDEGYTKELFFFFKAWITAPWMKIWKNLPPFHPRNIR